MRRIPKGRAGLVVAAAAVAATAAVSATQAKTGSALQTASMLTALAGPDPEVLITVGDTVKGHRFEAIPDGISLLPRGQGTVDVFVNHETSTVPFSYVFAGPTATNSQNDFDNAQVSRLRLHQKKHSVQNADLVIKSAEGYHRLCSNYLATEKEGFDRPILFTNEEGIDWVKRAGGTWPATTSDDDSRQIGVVVAMDAKNGKHTPIWGMGRHNHENSLAIPGYSKLVLLSGDDPFNTNAPQSQLYMYVADDTDALLKDEGDLYVFVSDTGGYDDYLDVLPPPAAPVVISGHFELVDKDVATGRNPDGTDMVASDKGYPPPPAPPAPPAVPVWQPDILDPTRGVDGPQWVLEHFSDLVGGFQFIRLEDMAYDKRWGMGKSVYLADSGRGTAAPAPGFGPGISTNGRIWKLQLNPTEPTGPAQLSVFIEGDDKPVKDPLRIHQPDNLETTKNSLMIQEDPGSSQQFNPGDANATEARIWRYDLGTSTMSPVAKVDQSLDETAIDEPISPTGRLGAWESSGIVDASGVFGPGTFLVTVQAHTLWIDVADGPDLRPPAGPDWTYKREGGQLLLLTVPGA